MRRASTERQPLPENLRRALRPFRNRLLVLRALEGFAAAGGIAWIAFAGALLLDRFAILSHAERTALAAGAIGAAALGALWALARILAAPDPVRLAWRLEASAGGTGEEIPSAVEISALPPVERRRSSDELVEALVRRAREKLRSLDAAAAIPFRGAGAAAVAVALLWALTTATLASGALSAHELALRFLHPALDLPRPSTVRLEVRPGDASAAAGTDVRVEALVLRGNPRTAWIAWRFGREPWRGEELRPSGRLGSEAGPRAFAKEFRSLGASLEYRVSAGDYASPAHRISVRRPPRPVSFRIAYAYPEYAGRDPETEVRSRGDIAAVAGTSATIEVAAGEPLARAWVEWFSLLPNPEERSAGPGGERRELRVDGSRAVLEDARIETSGGYRLYLVGLDGVSNGGRDVYAVRALADRPPSVEILEPREEEVSLGRSDVLPVRYEAADDLGLAAVDALVEIAGAERPVAVWPPPEGGPAPRGGPRSLAASFELDLRALEMEPGASATFCLRARDRRGLEARSAVRKVSVRASPPPPEGPGWPAPLWELESALALAARELPAVAPAPGDPQAPLPGRALALRRLVLAAAGEASGIAQALAFPTPARRALETAGRRLRRLGDDVLVEVWKEASLAARGEDSAHERLAAARAESEARLAAELLRVRLLLAEEELDEFADAALALERTARDGDRAAAAARLAAALSAAAAREAFRSPGVPPRLAEDLEALSVRLLDPAFAVESSRDAASRLAGARERAADAARREAAAAETEDAIGDLLAALAGQRPSEPGGATASRPSGERLLRGLLVELAAEVDRRSGAAEIDLEATGDLVAIARIAEGVRGGDPESTVVFRGLLRAYRATAPDRALGSIALDLRAAALAEGEIARRLGDASVRGYEEERALHRAGRDLAGFLQGAEAPLARLAREFRELEAESRAVARSRAEVEAIAREIGAGDREGAAARAAGAAERLSGAAFRLEALRARAFPEAASARAWLRARVGAPAARLRRLADAERDLAERIRALASSAEADSERGGAPSLRDEQERIRADAGKLAGDLRLGALASGPAAGSAADRERAALAILSLSARELLPVTRDLERSRAADAPSRPGVLLRASERALAGAEKLALLAEALDALETGEPLRLPEGLLERSGEPPAGADLEAASSEVAAERAARDAEKLLEVEGLEAELQELLRELGESAARSDDDLARARELGESIERELRENFLATSEIVELVASLVRLERDAREIAERERSLAAEVEKTVAASEERAAALRAEADALASRFRGLVQAFDASGLKLSSALPFVLRAFAEARRLSGVALSEVETAAADAAPASAKLLASADAVEAFVAAVAEVRRQALQALFDAERGGGGPNDAHLRLEEARRGIAEAIELLERGDLRRAAIAQSASLRSIAEARATLRKRLEALAAPEGEGESPAARLAGEEARALGLEWKAVVRGEDPRHALGSYLDLERRMPFPARFRALVRAYLEAIAAEGYR